jgi:hypothetical protein
LPTSGPSPSTPSSGRRPGREPGRRRRFRFRTGAPYLVPFLAASAAAAAVWFWRVELLNAGSAATLQSPETQVRQALAAQGRAHLEDIYGWKAGGTLELVPVRYADVVPDVEGNRASVVAVLDAEGKAVWRDQSATVSYIGREQFHMRPCKIALWCAEGDQFARLRAVLRTLFRRLDAERAGEPAAAVALAADDYRDGVTDREALQDRLRRELATPRPDVRVTGWQIRIERDVAEVGEDHEAGGESGDVRHRGQRGQRRRYRLERRGERWLFTSGL